MHVVCTCALYMYTHVVCMCIVYVHVYVHMYMHVLCVSCIYVQSIMYVCMLEVVAVFVVCIHLFLYWYAACYQVYPDTSVVIMFRFSEQTYSLWGYIWAHLDDFINPLYTEQSSHERLLLPNTGVPHLR